MSNLRLAKPPEPISTSRLILAVDDDADNLALVSSALEHEGYLVERASSGEDALEKLRHIRPDLVILDINMSGISGLDTLRHMRARENYVSVIFVSGCSDTSDVVAGLDAGADDYVCKPFDPLELLARVRAQLRIKDLNDRLAIANLQLRELVDIDDLTGLFNMRSIYQKIDMEIRRAKRFSRSVGVIMMDMDNFKTVNDNHDHLFGSFVLSEVGKIISANIRSVDFGARYGGDEFLVTLSETSTEGARHFAERLRHSIEHHLFDNGRDKMNLTMSMGISICPPSLAEMDARNLVRHADQALYEAKRSGKNKVCVNDALEQMVKKTS